MERKISANPSREEMRLHCLDMSVRSAQLMGRADNVTQLAETYFEWVVKQPTPDGLTEFERANARAMAEQQPPAAPSPPVAPPPEATREQRELSGLDRPNTGVPPVGMVSATGRAKPAA